MAQDRRQRTHANTSSERANDRPASGGEVEIRQRAYERFCERGGEHGRDLEDWLEAERELGEGASRRR